MNVSKLSSSIIVLLILASSFVVMNIPYASYAATADPASLQINISPSSVLADNNAYNCIYIQLLDSTGKPARALSNTIISLSSSLMNIGTVDSVITLSKGTTYATANFYSTLTPGTTLITASATGYSTVQAAITTVTPLPSAIAVYGFPNILPADGGTYPAIMVQLQDSSGSPKRAPHGGVNVTLICSETSVGTVSPSVVTIPYESTYAIANFTTTTTPSTNPARITSLANGYTPKQVEITTKPVTTDPKYLKIFVGPNQILADNNSYPQIAVELQDSDGNVAVVSSDIEINLISTELSIGQINSTLTVGPSSQFQSYAIATLNTTYKAGTTTLVAAATNFNPDQQIVHTIEFIPPKLAVFAVPSHLPSDSGTYSAIQVQLQDSKGRPAKNLQTDVTVNLFSQNPDVASINTMLTIPSGKTQATGNLTVTNSPGSTVITALTSGYSIGQAQVTTSVIDYSTLQVALTPNPTSIGNGNDANLKAYVTADGAAITGVTLAFTSNNGGTFTDVTELGDGYYTINFTAPNFSQTTTSTITATASKTNYFNGQGTAQVLVTPSPSPTPTPTTSSPTPAPTDTPTEGTEPINNSSGMIQLCIKDINDDPLNYTVVSSIIQPVGMGTLSEITNATGYVSFENIQTGSYTFNIIKQGYPIMNATIDVTGQPLTLTITLLDNTTNQANDGTLLSVIVIVVIGAAIALFGLLFLVRRKNLQKTRKLEELKKQLNNKY